MREVHVPAQVWEDFSNQLALMSLTNQKGSELISVPAFEHDGYLYMANGAIYTPLASTKASAVHAYRLLPEQLFSGRTTTIYHDEQAIALGTRSRGDLTGLIVKVKGKKAVCADRVDFVSSLPTTRPMPMAEAKAFDRESRKYGWRVFVANGIEPTWHLHKGHPVATYIDDNDATVIQVLYWKHGKQVKEMTLHEDLGIHPAMSEIVNEASVFEAQDQMQLF